MDEEKRATELAATVERVAAMVERDELVWALTAVAATVRREVDALERELVAELRGRGVAWATIGSALGVSRQSAHERFGGRLTTRDHSRDHLYTDDENAQADELVRMFAERCPESHDGQHVLEDGSVPGFPYVCIRCGEHIADEDGGDEFVVATLR